MTDLPGQDLNYGHFGQAIYEPQTQQWLFNRIPNRHRVLRIIGAPKRTALSESGRANNGDTEITCDTVRSDQIERQIQRIARTSSEVVPGLHLLPQLVSVSHAAIRTSSIYDPTHGERFAWGRAADMDNEGGKGRPVIAMASGRSGEVLRLSEVFEEQRGWENDRSLWLRVPTVAGEASHCFRNGSPLRQLVFGNAEGRGSILAARLPTETLLFKPLYRRMPTAASPKAFPSPDSSRLDANLILTIPMERTGRAPHAHIAFNPWYQNQLAIIDEQGAWSVWDITGQRRKRTTYGADLYKEGELKPLGQSSSLDGISSADVIPEDGWARILWVGNVTTLAVCQRRHLALLDIRGVPTVFYCPQPGLSRNSHWILDITRDPIHTERFFVLTSSSLYYYTVIVGREDNLDAETTSRAKVELAWRHFRDAEDISLQLSVVAEEDDVIVLLYSRLNTVITTFRFSQHPESSRVSVSAADPNDFRLPLPLEGSAPYTQNNIQSLSLQPIQYQQGDTLNGSGPGYEYMSRQVQFYSVTVMLADRSMVEYVLHSQTEDASAKPVEPLVWNKRLKGPTLRRPLDFRFVVDDYGEKGGKATVLSNIVNQRRQKLASHRREQLLRTTDPTDEKSLEVWTVPNELVYNQLLEMCGEQLDLADVLGEIKSAMVEGLSMLEKPFHSLLSLSAPSFNVPDPEYAEVIFQELARFSAPPAVAEEPGLEIAPIASPTFLKIGNSGKFSVTSTWEMLVECFISPLGDGIPGRLRLTKEKVARRIATEACFSSLRIRYQVPPVDADGDERDPARAIGLPVGVGGENLTISSFGPSASNTIEFLGGKLRSASQSAHGTPLPTPLATPPASATPSVISSVSYFSNTSGLSGVISRLRQHLSITNTPQPMTRSLTHILAHWELGADPEDYDWDTTRRALQAASDTEGEGLTDKERRRMQRKVDKLLKRQRRETAAAAMAASQSVPALLQTLEHPRSSPGPVVRTLTGLHRLGSGPGLLSSQVGGSGFMSSQSQAGSGGMPIASQVERGPFGARQKVGGLSRSTKKRKIRQEGF